tara:strand:+ start:501 stop:815 length:315 start_codon:yes stop_codon:yes gene_type:complete
MENLIKENNKLIAEFMELVYAPPSKRWEDWFTKDGIRVTFGSRIPLQYHSSWDWLMPVVETAYHNGAEENEIGDITHALLDCDREKTHEAVVEFIKFYNESKTK